MKAKNRFIFLAFFLSFIFSQQVFSQAQSFDDDFQQALQEYINKNLLRFGKNEIARERFLIQQMRDINAEIKSRVKNVSAVRDQDVLRTDIPMDDGPRASCSIGQLMGVVEGSGDQLLDVRFHVHFDRKISAG